MNRLPKFCLALLAFALVLGLAAPIVAAEAKGKIKTVDGDKHEFVLSDANARDWTFNVPKEAKVFLNDKESKLTDLQAGDTATIMYERKDDKLIASEVRCTRK
jgi:hypothetical protein